MEDIIDAKSHITIMLVKINNEITLILTHKSQVT